MDKQYWKVRIFVDLNIVELSFYREVPFHSGKFPLSMVIDRWMMLKSKKNQVCHSAESHTATLPPHPKHFRALSTDFLRVVPTADRTVVAIVLSDFVFYCYRFPEIWEPRSFFSIEIQWFTMEAPKNN